MGGRLERAAVALVALAGAMAGVELGLEALGRGSLAAVIAFAAIGGAAGGACLIAWARGPRADPRRLPLLLAGGVVPACVAFALAASVPRGPWAAVLTGAGLGGVAFAVIALYRRRP